MKQCSRKRTDKLASDTVSDYLKTVRCNEGFCMVLEGDMGVLLHAMMKALGITK